MVAGFGSIVNLYAKLPRTDHGTSLFAAFGAAITVGPVSLVIRAVLGTLLAFTGGHGCFCLVNTSSATDYARRYCTPCASDGMDLGRRFRRLSEQQRITGHGHRHRNRSRELHDDPVHLTRDKAVTTAHPVSRTPPTDTSQRRLDSPGSLSSRFVFTRPLRIRAQAPLTRQLHNDRQPLGSHMPVTQREDEQQTYG